MYLLIPIWGITGAAIAIAVSFFANNLMRFFFLYYKLRFQPFNYNFLLVIVTFAAAYLLGYILPQLPLIWDILLRGGMFAVVYLLLIIGLKVSEDVNETIIKFISEVIK